MKHFLVTCSILTLALQGFSQTKVSKKEVPQAVMTSYLSQNSSGSADSLWSKESITIYKVRYMDYGQAYEAQYVSDGRWIKTDSEIDLASLPAAVSNRVKEIYPKLTPSRAFIELNNDGKFYAVEIGQGNDKMTVYFTMSGKFVK